MNQVVGNFRMPPRVGIALPPSPGIQHADYGDLVAALEFRASQAVFPGFQRQNSSFHHVKTDFAEKLNNVSEGEYAIQSVLQRFFYQMLDHPASHTMRLSRFMHSQ